MDIQGARKTSGDAMECVSVKTPAPRPWSRQVKSRLSAWTTQFPVLGSIAHVLIVVSMGAYAFGHLYVSTPAYTTGVRATIAAWCKTHTEMIRPVYFVLFGVIPILASMLLGEFLRNYNVRRISSRYLLKFAMLMRRRPSFRGRVSRRSVGDWLFKLIVIGGNVFVFAYHYKTRRDRAVANSIKTKKPIPFDSHLQMIAVPLGFNALFNFAFLFLPATRNCMWMELLNISYANGIRYHRTLGTVTVLSAVAHCFFFYWMWIRQKAWATQALPCSGCDISKKPGNRRLMNFFGELALLSFLLIALTSIGRIRRRFYNVFYYTHHLFLLSVFFTVLHWGPSLWWVLPTFLLYGLNRAVSSSNAFAPVEVQELTALSEDVVKVVLRRSTDQSGQFRLGQFLYLHVPAISQLQWHPFTIASSPRAHPTDVTILLKSLGDWTRDLVAHAHECKKANALPTVYADGYYGASLEMYSDYSTLLLVGGGIGATPLLAILEDLVSRLALSISPRRPTQRVVFVFAFRELELLEEAHPTLLRLHEFDPHGQYHRLRFFLTRRPTEEALARPVNYDRLAGSSSERPTSYANHETGVSRIRPMYEPLRSRTTKSAVMLVVFGVGLAVVLVLTYGGKIKAGAHARLWPLQQFVEPLVLVAASLLAWVFIWADEFVRRRTAKDHPYTKELPRLSTSRSLPADNVRTLGELVNYYKVEVGTRPDAKALFAEAMAFHHEPLPTGSDRDLGSTKLRGPTPPEIGVFVSGPVALKRACESAIADLGSGHFDMHEEEFQL